MNTMSQDTRKPIIIGLSLLIGGVLTFLLWAFFAPLDEGVPTAGTLTVESKRKTISHLSGGIIKEIFVTEAQRVKMNDPLLQLDETIAKSNYDTTFQNLLSSRASESRLLAERSGAKEVAFPQTLTTSQHPMAKQYMSIQRSLFASRKHALSSEIAVMEAAAISEEMNADTLEKQLELFQRELSSLKALADEEYAPRNQLLQMERQILQTKAAAQKSRRNAIESRAKIEQRKQTFARDVDADIADNRKDIDGLQEKLRALSEELERTRIVAPVDGFVTDLSATTVGGVVTPGMRLMDIIPANENLIFEAQISPNLVDKVTSGMNARIQLHNFPETPQLNIDGRVISISADLITNKTPNQPPYYLARVEVTPEGKAELGNRQLQPGMQAEVLIRTGERTFITYLLKPLFRRINSAMKE